MSAKKEIFHTAKNGIEYAIKITSPEKDTHSVSFIVYEVTKSGNAFDLTVDKEYEFYLTGTVRYDGSFDMSFNDLSLILDGKEGIDQHHEILKALYEKCSQIIEIMD